VRRFRRSDDGAAAVEFAILLPLFLVLVFGLITGGFAFERWINVTQAARESSRFAATYPGTNADWYTQAVQVAKDNAGISSSMAASEYYVCVSFQPGSESSAKFPARQISTAGSLAPTGAAAPSNADGCIPGSSQPGAHVEVVVRRAATFDWIFGGGNLVVQGDNTSRYEGPRT
jgi:Flp pilus assembly pilin Flp